MLEPHDGSFGADAGSNGELFGEVFVGNTQRVVTHGGKGSLYSFEDAFPVVFNEAGFAVHDFGGVFDGSAESRGDALMSEADSEQGGRGAELENDLAAYTEIFRIFHGTRSW